MLRIALAFVLLAISGAAFARAEAPVTVAAPSGTYVGTATNDGRRFLGIRYAQAPVGALRWAPPRPVGRASRPYSAQSFGSRCVQPVDQWQFNPRPGEPMQGSEDCLFLNVYTPRSDAAAAWPVIVWTHGGGFMTGVGSDYDPHLLAEKQGVVVVTINYRLGALGFLSHPALGDASGGFGMLDQQAALRWVQRNIRAFGGDPSKVAIFGESAGGVSICAQLRSPSAAGLFSRAIIQSGPCVAVDRPAADQKGVEYSRIASCPEQGRAAVACLRRLSAYGAGSTPPTTQVGLGDTPWPLVQGTSLLPGTVASFETGQFNRVPVLNGSNLDEGRAFALASLSSLRTQDDYLANLQVQFGRRAAAIADLYPAQSYPSIALAYSAYMTDWLFACPALASSKAMSRYVPVYAYEFRDRTAPTDGEVPEVLGSLDAYHGAEIQYVFQRPTPFSGPATFDARQRVLADRIQQAWATFARDGAPSTAEAQPWMPLTAQDVEIQSLDIDGEQSVRGFAEQHQCDF